MMAHVALPSHGGRQLHAHGQAQAKASGSDYFRRQAQGTGAAVVAGRRPGGPVSSSFVISASGGRLEGLMNLGNTCYLNSVLQGLLSLRSLHQDLLSSVWAAGTGSPLAELAAPGLRVYASLLRVMLAMRKPSHAVEDPTPFRKVSEEWAHATPRDATHAACLPPHT
jgi:hypothetical protein